MLLADAIATYVADRQAAGEICERSARQLEWRLATLSGCHPGLEICELSRVHVRAWQHATGWQRPASRRAYLSTLRVFCAWALEAGYLSSDPTIGLGRVRVPGGQPRGLTDGQMARLLMVLPDDRARLIVALMRQCGLRCVEVARLRGVDFDPAGPRIWVHGKGDRWDSLPVLDNLAEILASWAPNVGARPLVGLCAGRISRLVSLWMDQAGIKTGPRDGISAHALRHTAASNMLDGCQNVRTVQRFLRHESLATTQRYVRESSETEIRAAMSASA